jgi:hypothetical protein
MIGRIRMQELLKKPAGLFLWDRQPEPVVSPAG